ncbi:hypothetical protein BWI93_07700 [Siphonobacter sp. BAB-5385]|uniref:hypothetical protein n=2 Tax=unclassified Siphonobacter TaxID=2635712 RepID=UPI000B9E4C90|nr:hypothetical protein [Siphonobacter sp. BAB-5385]OZI08729.1 hypothetical protein BWI93_07700 [Siphonobacter sp. BAB-5385]
MKRLLPIACLLTACTTPSQKPIQPVFDTLDYSYSYAWQPRRSYSLKIAKDGEAWLAIRARREWEYFQGHLSDESLQILHRQARVLFSSSFPKSFRSSTPDLDCYQLLLTSPKGQRKAF